jgi:hypothetical protein
MKFPAHDRNVGPENLMFDDDIDINDVKNSAMATYRQRHVDIHFDSDFNIMSVQFVLLNNIFASKGYHFTDSNREEIYLDILNSGDVELIGMLEQFLDLFNEYNDYKYHIDIYMNMKLETKECTSIPDVHAVYEKFAKETLLHGMNSDN